MKKKSNLIQIICKPHIHDFKTGSSPFVFAEKPSSVQIMDKPEVLQKDKLVTVRLETLHFSGLYGANVNSSYYKPWILHK